MATESEQKDMSGVKLDEGKLELWDFFETFGLAVEAVAKHAQWGISVGNRGWANQRAVDRRRYLHAILRHVLAEINHPGSLDEYGKEHWPAIVWNALEILQRQELAKELPPTQNQGESNLQAHDALTKEHAQRLSDMTSYMRGGPDPGPNLKGGPDQESKAQDTQICYKAMDRPRRVGELSRDEALEALNRLPTATEMQRKYYAVDRPPLRPFQKPKDV